MRILSVLRGEKLKSSLSMAIKEILPDAELIYVKDVESAKEKIENEATIVFVFVQFGFSQSEVLQIIESIKENNHEEKARIILVVPEDDSDEKLLSQYLSIGFSGMLVEPFSYNVMKEVMKLSDTLTLAGSIARLTVAAGLQIKAHLIDENKMPNGGNLLESVRQACKIFEQENPGKTVKSVAEDISTLSLEERAKVNIKHIYTGASKRVKELLNKKNSTQY